MKPQSKWNEAWSKKQLDSGLCRFCKNVHLNGQKVCAICYLKVLAKNNLNSRELGEKLYLKLIEQDYKCYLTGNDIEIGVNASIDHVIPRSKNPDLQHDIDNIKWCDKRVNLMKKDLLIDEFFEICKKVIAHNDL